ncbi:unnamed protein product [Phytophthora fragariaefolia]|uniref:Unnamed protein product n=1 Tax=Phytophthora fragariaefolia TaxID=1490495 RepID=A0A9W6YF41_9STRA|nr:unnamed protein product [Phytophthora fragariaefolia]
MFARLLQRTVMLAFTLATISKSIAGQLNREHSVRELENNEANWPSLRFDFTLKRSSMRLYGQSTFSMVANPVISNQGASVIYNTFATFTEGPMVYNYTYLDGSAFISKGCQNDNTVNHTVECLGSESGNLPPINAIVEAIINATAVSENADNIRCSTDHLFEVSIVGIKFSMCASGTGLKMYGTDMNIVVEYVRRPLDISPFPKSVEACKTLVSPSSVTSTGKVLLAGELTSSNTGRKLKAEFDFTFWSDGSDDESHSSSSDTHHNTENHGCSCKSTRRPCLFIHGMGIDKEEPTNVDSFGYYWGNLTDHAPCCSSIKYTVLNTINNSWMSDTQQQKVCDRALDVSGTSVNSTIRDTILVTHSMGNLMLAGAIASQKCTLDSSSTWVGLAGPMKGSMGSDFVQASCAGETNGLLEQVADITGKCPPTTALVSLAYQGERFSSSKHDAAYTAAQKAYTANVYALMCSAGYSGLVSKYQAAFWALGATVPHKSGDNDGMVEFLSCAAGIPESQFGDTWRSRFYKTKLNHYDSEFLYGDGLLSEAKKPVKWFECLL